jgi:hypothetical protein
MINYDGRVFRPVQTGETGEADSGTTFRYFQDGDLVWAEYEGGSIAKGHLVAIADASGCLNMRYHHVNTSGELMTGICGSIPEVLPDGRLRLLEKWQWTSGDLSSGESILEEVAAA